MKVYLYTILGGGAEKVSYDVTHYLQDTFTWHICATSGSPTFFRDSDVEILKPRNRKNLLIELIRWIPAFVRLDRSIKTFNPDIILLSGFQAMFTLLRWFRLIDTPVVCIIHAPPSNDVLNREYGTIQRFISAVLIKYFLSPVEKVVACSQATLEELHKVYSIDRIRLENIPNSIDIESIALRAAEPIPPEDFQCLSHNPVITAGRLVDAKGQWHLIRAFRMVVDQCPEATLVIIGEGGLFNYLESLINGLDLVNSVYLLGHRDNPFPYLRHAACFVLPSIFEGFPVILLEAMACCLPIISTDCHSGPREILTDHLFQKPLASAVELDTGFLLPVCDGKHYTFFEPLSAEEKLLADTIIKLQHNPELKSRLGSASKDRANQFTHNFLIPKYKDLLVTTANMYRKNA